MNNMNSKQLENWADRLLAEYDEGWKGLNKTKDNLRDDFLPDQQDKTHINSMIDSMTYSIDWMRTGRQPDMYRGVDKKDKYRAKFYDDMDILPDINEELRKEREPLYMSQEQRMALIQLFRNFSDRERQCYVMHTAEGLSMQQIADKLGLSKWTVRTYINRAKEKVEEITAA
ncbi:sigma-70 family RNA polymerase sigma factor [Oceanobacillus alkalisoli]|uniref:sigma-70 family RNA polymerase sigma factor n=1 Tax=Oceanobacillus alkalisoli TaxID=2925113 RepID=UPI001EE4436A|nr:sigma-70 family RNA polymerase sigma factor [Oceanobacillus alkalisoli]MCG5104435.1 sigma-70 family RNA polymerase sigma factor [Oceanobacillus alkalisoli]